MNRIFKTLALVGLVNLSSAQIFSAADLMHINQGLSMIKPADVESVLQSVMTNPAILAQPQIVPYVANATTIAGSLIQSAILGADVSSEVVNAVDVKDNGDNSDVVVSGGKATLTFWKVSDNTAASLEQVYDNFEQSSNVAVAVSSIRSIFAQDKQPSAVAIVAIIDALLSKASGSGVQVTIPIAEEGASNEEAVEEEGESNEEVVEEEGQSNEEVVEEEGQSNEEVVEEEGASNEEVVEEEGQSNEEVVEEEGQSNEEVVEEEGASNEEVVEEGVAQEEGSAPVKCSSKAKKI